MMLEWSDSSCRNMISRKVLCASVAHEKASKIFFRATASPLRRSTARQTMP